MNPLTQLIKEQENQYPISALHGEAKKEVLAWNRASMIALIEKQMELLKETLEKLK